MIPVNNQNSPENQLAVCENAVIPSVPARPPVIRGVPHRTFLGRYPIANDRGVTLDNVTFTGYLTTTSQPLPGVCVSRRRRATALV